MSVTKESLLGNAAPYLLNFCGIKPETKNQLLDKPTKKDINRNSSLYAISPYKCEQLDRPSMYLPSGSNQAFEQI